MRDLHSVHLRPGLCLAVALALAVAGCGSVAATSGDEVVIDLGSVSTYFPRLRDKVAWPTANDYCKTLGKSPHLENIDGSLATYRCVDPS